jgi:hypothetical protein
MYYILRLTRLIILPLGALSLIFTLSQPALSDDSVVPAAQPSVMMTFEVGATLDDFVQAYYDCQTRSMKGCYPKPFYKKLTVIALSEEGTVRAFSYQTYLFSNAISWADTHRTESSPSLESYLGDGNQISWHYPSQCLVLVYSNKKAGTLHITFIIPIETVGIASERLPKIDSSSYCIATLPALSYRQFMHKLDSIKPGLIKIDSESFGEDYSAWEAMSAKPREPGDHSPRAAYPYGSPHAVWLETKGEEGKAELLNALHNAFGYFSDVGYTNAIIQRSKPLGYLDIDSAVLDLPPTQMFQTYRTWVGPPASHKALLPEELVKVLDDWDTIHVGMYTLTDGDLQLFFFRGVSG